MLSISPLCCNYIHISLRKCFAYLVCACLNPYDLDSAGMKRRKKMYKNKFVDTRRTEPPFLEYFRLTTSAQHVGTFRRYRQKTAVLLLDYIKLALSTKEFLPAFFDRDRWPFPLRMRWHESASIFQYQIISGNPQPIVDGGNSSKSEKQMATMASLFVTSAKAKINKYNKLQSLKCHFGWFHQSNRRRIFIGKPISMSGKRFLSGL